MQTEKILVWSDGQGMEDALDTTENFAKETGLNEKHSRRLRLLAEETLGMVRAIVEEYKAEFWLDETNGKCTIHLTGDALMNSDKKHKLIAASSDKKNAASVGIMGKILDIFEAGFEVLHASPVFMSSGSLATMQADVYTWSLEQYRKDIEKSADDEEYAEALDELEKSIVANIADDIRVAVSGDRIELTIEKTFAQ